MINNNATTYESDGASFFILTKNNFPTKLNKMYYGDFNGDGIMDALSYSSILKEWRLHTGIGNNIFTQPGQIITQLDANPTNSHPKHPVIIADINGDGKDEIIQSYNFIAEGVGKTRLDFYNLTNFTLTGTCTVTRIHRDTLNELCTVADMFKLGDFNADGRINIFIRSHINLKPRIIFANKNERYEFVTEIEDGMGKIIDLSYNHQYFIASSYFQWGIHKRIFLTTVESVKLSNGIGSGLNMWQYQYDLPAYSFLRKTFLGFKEHICINTIENKKEVLSFTVNDVREILIPNSQSSFCNNQKTSERLYSFQIKDLPKHRFASCYSNITDKDFLSDTKTETTTTLQTDGRLATANSKTFNACNATTWLHSETNAYIYNTITLDGNQKKTVPIQILTTQQYGSSGIVISDTTTYNYYTAAPNKGRLNWVRKGNIHGSITTSYDNYTTAGLYGRKTLSAPEISRSETYTYDATQRFVTQVSNPLNHITKFSYNLKTGDKTSETDINNLTTNFYYDAFGNLTKVTYPEVPETINTIHWDTASTIPNARYFTKTTSVGAPEVIVYYDKLGREVCRLDDGYYYDTRYNNKGQLVQTSYPYKNMLTLDTKKTWNSFTYDIYGRKLTEKAPYTDLTYTYDLVDKRKVKVTDHKRNDITAWKNYDALGRLIAAHDEGGDIDYVYTVTADRKHKTTITTNNAITTIIADLWGNRLTIDEPNAGLITSEYNKFNELVKQTDAKGNIITYQYDLLGRVTQKKYADSKNILTLDYIYDNAEGKGKGKLALIKKDHIKAKEFTYDNYGRLIKDMNFDGAYRFEYTYTPNGQLNTMTYPGGFSITYNYTPAGKLKTIRRSSDNSLIYEVSARNEFGATRLCQFGNGLATEYSYDRYGLLTDIQTGNKVFVPEEEEMHPKGGGGIPGIYTTDASILNYNYTYNTRGIMSSRSESIINQQETFTYDNLDRLTGFRYSYPGEPSTTKNFTYHDNGNILANDKLGSYYYSNTQKHAVTQIMPINQNVISQNECAVDYNFFNQPTQIEEGDTRLDISYGINQQRNKAVKSVNKEVTNVHYYGNKYYEGEVDHFDDTTSIRRHYHYIYGDRGVVAMYLTTRTGKDTASMEPDTLENPTIPVDKSIITTDSMYYIHTDHLGSYCAITSSAKQIVQRNWFDPWGNYQIRYDTIFSKKPQPTIIENNFTLTNRGFTGHEHYPYFKIINMNGRLYDPVIGRFFSPDKFVANSSFTQDFNRYSYCRNNPLSYTDPSGEFLCMIPALVIGAAWCAIMGGIEGQKHGATGWNMAAYIIGGAAIGAVSALGAYGIGIGCATAGFGAVTGMVSGGLSGLMSGTINGVGMAALAGKSSKDIYYSTLSGGLMGMGMGAFFGGISDIGNAVASRAGAISNINNAVINGGGYRGESGEMGGGNDIGSIFLDETIPPGACPTRTGEIATTTTNPNYGKYGWTRSGGKQAHYGIDYYGEVGDSVRSMYNGVVERIGAGPKLGKHCVTISSDIGGTTYKVQYGHLSRALVIQNQEVAAGDIIGLMGRVGIPNAYPTHVHIQIWRQMVIQGVTYRGFVQPSWNWIPSSTIPWQYRLYY